MSQSALQEKMDKKSAGADPSAEAPIPGFVRVDLLPPGVAERAAIAAAKRLTLYCIGGGLVVTAGLLALAIQDGRSAQNELDAAESEAVLIQQQLSELSTVPETFAKATLAQKTIESAMGSEIRWSFLLNQMSFSTPSGVTLNSITGQSATSNSETPAVPAEGGPPEGTVGTMTFESVGTSLDRVAAWLDSLEGLKDYTTPFLSAATREEEAGGYNFQSDAFLTSEALSGRYTSQGSEAATPTPTPTPSPAPAPAPTGGA